VETINLHGYHHYGAWLIERNVQIHSRCRWSGRRQAYQQRSNCPERLIIGANDRAILRSAARSRIAFCGNAGGDDGRL
jgi:hypothetical protein